MNIFPLIRNDRDLLVQALLPANLYALQSKIFSEEDIKEQSCSISDLAVRNAMTLYCIMIFLTFANPLNLKSFSEILTLFEYEKMRECFGCKNLDLDTELEKVRTYTPVTLPALELINYSNYP